jgi:ribonuclease D
MPNMDKPLLIDRPDALAGFVEEAKDAAWLGLDTEFVRDRHYYPQAGLIQIATPGRIALVDPVALPDLSPLKDLLCDTGMTKILHAGRQDLELFLLLFDAVPQPLYDTQVAAAMIDMAPQIGYAALAEELLQEPPGIALGRYNWLKRPLAEKAIGYAATDVEHLARMRDVLDRRLDEAGKRGEFEAAMQEMENPDHYRPQPERAWKRIRQARRLGSQPRERLKHLAAWRERQAMEENRPRQWVLRDGVLVTLARLAPSTSEDLAAVRDLDAPERRRYGPALLETLAAVPAVEERES